MLPEDDCQASVKLFNQFAERYAEKYFDLEQYDRFYAMFAAQLPHAARVVDIACGPGNVSAYLLRHRPDLSLTGVDLAPKMIDIARQRVPAGQFFVGDCRRLHELATDCDGAVFAFGLSYLNQTDAEQFFTSLNRVLNADAVLLLTTISASESSSRYERSSSGDELLTVYRTPQEMSDMLVSYGFEVQFVELVASPANAPSPTQDVVLIAKKLAQQI